MDLLDKITNIASKKQTQDDQYEGQELLNQVRILFDEKFGKASLWSELKKIIINAEPEQYQKIIEKISALSFSDEEFAEVMMPLQKYRSYKNLTPAQRELQEVLIDLLQLFTKQMGGEYLATLGKQVGQMFNTRLDEENDEFEGMKPIELLTSIDKDFSLNGTEIEGTFLDGSQAK